MKQDDDRVYGASVALNLALPYREGMFCENGG